MPEHQAVPHRLPRPRSRQTCVEDWHPQGGLGTRGPHHNPIRDVRDVMALAREMWAGGGGPAPPSEQLFSFGRVFDLFVHVFFNCKTCDFRPREKAGELQ